MVCRVLPDVPALDRVFDYLVPASLVEQVRVGALVRIALHGRRLRGWVVEVDVEPGVEPARLRPIVAMLGDGPPPEIVDLTAWAAWRWAGPRVAFFRAAAPPGLVPQPSLRPELRQARSWTQRTGEGPRLIRTAPNVDRLPRLSALLDEHLIDGSGAGTEGSAIVIDPDSRRAARLVEMLSRQGRRAVLWSSDQSDAERRASWTAARRGGVVVVGGRIAAWAPVPDLALVVLFDDPDESHKEERAPSWDARDVVRERARRLGVPMVSMGPLFTLEALAAGTLEVPGRDAERAGWPVVEVADRREEPPGLGLISPALVDGLRAHVEAGRRVVCVLNRKGRARLLACGQCRALVTCEHCASALRDDGEQLVCPLCGTRRPRVCGACGSIRMALLRPGVKRLVEELSALVPRSTTIELTGDAPVDPSAIAHAAVIVGTEAALHRAGRGVGLVAFLDLDEELAAPRFRAAEQTLWMMARAARLVGGRPGPGRLLLQTRMPDHPVVRAVVHANPSLAVEAERERRLISNVPPFSALAEIRGSPSEVAQSAAVLEAITGIVVLGPLAAARGLSHRALVKASTVVMLCDALAQIAGTAHAPSPVRIEVDPRRV